MRRGLLTALLVIALALVTNSALAVSIEKAEKLYQQARQLFDQGKYKDALTLFIQAYETYPKAKYVFNIAQCYEKMGNLPKALEAYETFIPYDQNQQVINRVQKEIERLKKILRKSYGEVFVATSPGKATVIFDQISKQNMYKSPARRWLKEGKHVIILQADGFLPRQLNIDVKRGESLYIYVGLKPAK